MENDETKYVLAIDQGSTSTRAVFYDHSGRKVIESTKPLPQICDKNGWVEQDPDTIWSSVLSAISSAMIDARIHPESIKAIGITNQRETTVVWDKNTGKPIYNAIGWLSKQTSGIANELRDNGYGPMIHEKTGLVLNAYFSATKVRWILDHVAGAQTRAEQGELLFGTIDSWLVWKLSDGKYHITDYSNASRTMLYNIHELKWDQEILDILHIPVQMLPEVHASDEVYGTTENYQFYGVQVPIAGIAGDQQAALIGSMGFEPGMVETTYGDGAFIMMNTGDQPEISDEKLLTTIAYGMNGKVCYALEGSIFTAGNALKWLRDQLGLISSIPASRIAAKRSTNNNEVYVVPAFTGLGAPYWDSTVRGAIFGITRGTNDDDIVKATLQSIAYSTKDVIDTMEADANIQIPQLGADGGASRNSYLMQFQADILNKPVERSADEETTAFGAAVLAGLATCYWKDIDEVKSIHEPGKMFEPNMEKTEREKLYNGWQRAVSAARTFKPEIN
ncbi:glycerol kinase GlpK [Fructilactobacillus sp. Tb1]|uniref:glycerol kinase GlpK n=1 Tax=Fructilactobacillus sp. Tb1 TaxID=3422304 RepID=UPI003D2C37FC